MEKTVIFGEPKKQERDGGGAVGNMHSPDVRSPRRNKNDTTTMTTELCA